MPEALIEIAPSRYHGLVPDYEHWVDYINDRRSQHRPAQHSIQQQVMQATEPAWKLEETPKQKPEPEPRKESADVKTGLASAVVLRARSHMHGGEAITNLAQALEHNRHERKEKQNKKRHPQDKAGFFVALVTAQGHGRYNQSLSFVKNFLLESADERRQYLALRRN